MRFRHLEPDVRDITCICAAGHESTDPGNARLWPVPIPPCGASLELSRWRATFVHLLLQGHCLPPALAMACQELGLRCETGEAWPSSTVRILLRDARCNGRPLESRP